MNPIEHFCTLIDDDTPFLYNTQGVLTHRQFWQQVADKVALLRTLDQHSYALWQEDFAEFASWLLGAVLAEKTVILPPNQPLLSHLSKTQSLVNLAQYTAPATQHTLSLQSAIALLDKPSLHFYTSGSTGTPKLIARSLGQILQEAQTLSQRFSLLQESVIYRSVSHQHIYGLTFGLGVPLATRCAICTPQIATPETLDKLTITHQKPAILVSSPALLKRCAGVFDFAVQGIFCAGGRLERGVGVHYTAPVVEIFGSTETGAIAWRDGKQSALWQPLDDVKISVDNGLLTVQSARAYQDTPIITQDMIDLHQDGFELLGRSDRIIKHEEKRLSLDHIETVITALPQVEDCRVLTIKHGQRDFLSAVVVLTPEYEPWLRTQGKKALTDTLKHALKDQLEPIALPKHWRFVATLPYNSQSKLNATWLHQLFTDSTHPTMLKQQQDADHATYQVQFLSHLDCFKGHFDGFAVYPGVGQLGMVIDLAGQTWHDLGYCMGYEQVKFSQLIRPFDVIDITLTKVGHKISFTLTNATQSVATGRLLFGQSND